jgi:hypothetical protein
MTGNLFIDIVCLTFIGGGCIALVWIGIVMGIKFTKEIWKS